MGAILVLLALGALTFAGWELWSVSSLLTQGVSVPGEVVAIETGGTTKEGETFYYPVYEYTDAQGGEHRRRVKLGSTRAGVDVGDPVEVLYVEGAPAEGTLRDREELWLRPAIVGFFGGVFFLFGLVMYLELGREGGTA